MKKVLKGVLFFMCIVNANWAFAWRSELKSDEIVLFLPGFALEQADGFFSVNVDAWVFEKRPRHLAVSALASWMEIDLKKISPAQKATFVERTRYFRTDSERSKRLRVRLADQVFTLPRTNSAGRTHSQLSVGREQVNWQGELGGFGWIVWALEAPGHPLHGRKGRALVIPADGVSIVSDIDDTIKISEVLNKKALIRKTFLEPFQAVPGMAEWYQEMSHNELQASFHYLSASPIQLYSALSEFLKDARFPTGLLHLREATSWRTMYPKRNDSIAHKKNTLIRLLTDFPRRKFIFIGDSGENDPEIYADITRSYPGRVLSIHIRNVTGENRNAPRYQQTFSGIDPQIWHIRD